MKRLLLMLLCLGGSASAQVTMNIASPQQTIDGFGTAQWRGANGQILTNSVWSEAQLDLLFDPAKGIGLNIMRIGIASVDSPGENTGAAMGVGVTFMDYDVGYNDTLLLIRRIALRQPTLKVIAEAWSANAACKSGGSINSGSFLTSCNSSWSTVIGNAVDAFNYAMRDMNISLYGVGTGNEPDFDPAGSYQGMTFTPAALTAWAKVLCPVVHAKLPAPLCMVGSAGQWVNTFSGGSDYVGNCTGDSTCLAATDIWTTHQYGTPIGNVVAPGTLTGRKLWMMEASNKDGSTNDLMTGTGGGVAWAIFIHNALVTGQVSAWVAWRAVSASPSNDDGLIDDETNGSVTSAVSKRLWTLGNFSKFIKPGMIRYPITGSPPANVSVSTFKGNGGIAVVAINNQGSTAALTVTLDTTSTVGVVTPYVTDATNNLVAQAPIPVPSHVISYTLSANSVTTFYGNGL